MGMKLEKQFDLGETVDEGWKVVVEGGRGCSWMAGAEVAEVVDERAFRGGMKVKVGPVTVAYKGQARIVEIDDAGRAVKLLGEGKEAGSGGAVKALITSRVVGLPGGLARVAIDADVDLAGKIVQFGRGMIDQVTDQLFARFVAGVRAQLAAPTDVPAAAGASGTAATAGRIAPGRERSARAEPIHLVPLPPRAVSGALANALPRLFRRRALRAPG